jgi:preprotein translocase subunit YajC
MLKIILLSIGALIFVIYVIYEIRSSIKIQKEYREYLKSIKVGDVFKLSFIYGNVRNDPFDEKKEVEYMSIITDIKKNSNGITWVKYTDLYSGEQLTDEIDDFLLYRTRVEDWDGQISIRN